MNHWISCNVYAKTFKSVQKQLEEQFAKFKYLKDYPKGKRKTTYQKEYDTFVKYCGKLLS